jgi:hypothetical protein
MVEIPGAETEPLIPRTFCAQLDELRPETAVGPLQEGRVSRGRRNTLSILRGCGDRVGFGLFNFDRAISMKFGLRPVVCGCGGIVLARFNSPFIHRLWCGPACQQPPGGRGRGPCTCPVSSRSGCGRGGRRRSWPTTPRRRSAWRRTCGMSAWSPLAPRDHREPRSTASSLVFGFSVVLVTLRNLFAAEMAHVAELLMGGDGSDGYRHRLCGLGLSALDGHHDGANDAHDQGHDARQPDDGPAVGPAPDDDPAQIPASGGHGWVSAVMTWVR